ncbi:hypothetical protein IKF81_02955 [Candidatus Saccharibacteria bacterium]|nr:hypothetical protein [Candidatus Saccharibacteria bacterium]
MKKIVTKVRLHGRDEFEDKLARAGYDFGPIYWQHDRIYLPRGYRRGQGFPIFVMRTEMKAVDRPPKYFLILRRHIDDIDIELEFVTVVKDYLEAVEIVKQLGFELDVEVSRKRQELKLKNGRTLYLDDIEGLSGFFAKVEASLADSDVVEKKRLECEEVFRKFEERNFYEQTYAELLRTKNS